MNNKHAQTNTVMWPDILWYWICFIVMQFSCLNESCDSSFLHNVKVATYLTGFRFVCQKPISEHMGIQFCWYFDVASCRNVHVLIPEGVFDSYLWYQENEGLPVFLPIHAMTGKTVNRMATPLLILWSYFGILSASTWSTLANNREERVDRYLPENWEISTWGLQSRLWSWARGGSIHRTDELQSYDAASLSFDCLR